MVMQLSTQTVTARKGHRCYACNTVAVQPGDTYTRSNNLYDGRVYTLVACNGCESMLSDVFTWAGDPDEGIDSESFMDWALDYRHEDERAVAYLARVGWVE
jgi:antirestriction protein